MRPVGDGLVKRDGGAGAGDAFDREDCLQAACVAAFSYSGAAIPATLFRIAVDLAPRSGSTAAAIGLMQQLFNAGSVAGPALAAWLVSRTGTWQSTWWMTCAFAGLGGLLSVYLSERRLRITFGHRHRGRTPSGGGTGPMVWRPTSPGRGSGWSGSGSAS